MKISKVSIRNFRRLENVEFSFESDETVFVGPNNSGKTSATTAFRLFLDNPKFKIHDFTVSKAEQLNRFGEDDDAKEIELPAIEMDLWFKIDPNVEFGRVFSLLPQASTKLEEVGIRMKYMIKDALRLRTDYCAAFPQAKNGSRQKNLCQFLALNALNKYFAMNYFALENTKTGVLEHPREPEEGKRTISSLVRVDFVDAQRNIDDNEVGRSNRLSAAFAAFYKKNLEQPDACREATQVIEENNKSLTQHYETHFENLMEVIQNLGVPSVNDREMRLVSSLSPEEALQGSTDLLYIDDTLNHELPEAYNGLGFKNLVYMAIQIKHFHLQWIRTEETRPLCQVIFIEEPEVHLHAQVQQAFISNIWSIVQKTSEEVNERSMVPQLAVTTHSSHILDTVDFEKVRYFQRCLLVGQSADKKAVRNATKILSLRDFRPDKKAAPKDVKDEKETLRFLKRYLKLTHCDLFFADAAVLIEGTAEKLLLPAMIERSAPKLKQCYLTVLEVGGAHAHRFASLMKFLSLSYLIITDIDSVDPKTNGSACRADTVDAVTSNSTIKFFIKKSKVSELSKLKLKSQTVADDNCFVAFQKPTSIPGYGPKKSMYGRTFEETFSYQNIEMFRKGEMDLGVDLSAVKDLKAEYQSIYERVKSSSFKKAEFALDIALNEGDWVTPKYIQEGLAWLEKKLLP